MTGMRRAKRVGWGALAFALGCAGGGQAAREMGGALGQGALVGFSDYVQYHTQGGEDEWGDTWNVSGRGATGVVPRSPAKPDCALVDDESQLYVGDLLSNPSTFVSTLDGALDEAAYRPLTGAKFKLTGERAGGVIAVLHTTAGRHARFVLKWDQDQRPLLHDVTVYDPDTGATALRFEMPMPLAPEALVNLDPGEGHGVDLLFGPAPDGRLTLAAGEGAGLSFPMASLCEGS